MNDLEIMAAIGNASAKLTELGWSPSWRALPFDSVEVLLVARMPGGRQYQVQRAIDLVRCRQAKIDVVWQECEAAIRGMQLAIEGDTDDDG